ncbi:ABC transporter permease [Glycomyces sp. L485]|uniref:ABC transporter permease n=1 Tax=Glycomyces sp. L485 TaxID=2909235 RepID=UPI001F4B7614|nr:ABC transporter permease [Glycomyces sp. L485]MCH7230570.1 ABC transporter permease [Glycomyces sp. L485]
MTILLFARRFLSEYARNPVNLIVLVLVPIVFVVVASGSMADTARLLGGPGGLEVQTATAGWAAAFLAAVAMYFQTRAARAVDRRLVLAGLRPIRLVSARLGAGLALALLVSAAALLALEIRGAAEPSWRVLAGTLMFAGVYLAIGALVGALVRNPVNGTVLILFVWIVDVFFGPAIASPDRLVTRWLPTHFVTLWMVDLPSRHGGRLGDLGWALTWTIGSLAVGWLVIVATTRVTRRRSRFLRTDSRWPRFATGVRMGLRDYGRNPVLWALLIIVPGVFILMAEAATPEESTTMALVDDGGRVELTFWLPDVHAGTMAPIAIASLAALAGLFVVLDSRSGDQRLVQAGFRAIPLFSARLAVIIFAVLLVTGVSLAVTATVFDARQWPVYAGGSVLLGLTYGLLGVCLGPVFGRVSGVFIAFLVPFLDVGIGQSPMLRAEPPAWARPLPGYGASRVLLDGGLTADFNEIGSLLLALAWLLVLGVAAAIVWRHAPAAPVRRTSGS